MASSSDRQDDSSDTDDSLDPLSPHFDPRKALYAKSVKLPVPDAKQFNNLAELENFMKGKDARTLNKQKPKKPVLPGIIAKRAAEQAKEAVRKAAIMEKSQGPSQLSQTQMRKRQATSIFTKMENYAKGPMSLLRRCVEERCRVMVIVRAAVAVKSRCRGYIVAFDKHLNMALMDVDETFLKPVKREKKLHSETAIEAQQMDLLSSQTENLQCGSGDERLESKHSTGKSKVKTNSGKDSSDLSTAPVAVKGKPHQGTSHHREDVVSGSLSKNTQKEVRRTGGSKIVSGDCSAFWKAYKPWAEQRCYTEYEIVQRHVNQLFLRGDNVVSVAVDQT